jgi:hypothetical protein
MLIFAQPADSTVTVGSVTGHLSSRYFRLLMLRGCAEFMYDGFPSQSLIDQSID